MIFNPFTIYSLMWFGVLSLYSLDIGLIYPKLSNKLYVFLIITSFISLILGIFYRDKFIINKLKRLKLKKYVILQKLKMMRKIVLLICLFFSLEIFLEGKIPLLEIIKRTGYTRHNFQGIRNVHYFMIIFTVFYSQRLVTNFIQIRRKKIILYYIIVNFIFLILYLRGIFFISLFMSLMIFIINKKIKKRVLLLVGVVLIYLFGIIGNIREGDTWNGNRTFIRSKVIKKNKIIDGPWIFSYVYFTNSLANLSLNIKKENIKLSKRNFILKNMVPDFISKRFEENSKREYRLIMPSLNTITTYTEAYIYLDFWGMYLMFGLYMIILIYFSTIVLKITKYKNELIAILFTMIFFTFFTNTLVFSLISFQLIFPIINYLIDKFIVSKSKLYI